MRNTQAVFVLAHGTVGEPLSVDSRVNVAGVAEMISSLPNVHDVYFVGGRAYRPEDHSTSQDGANLFLQEMKKRGQLLNVRVLDRSHDTVSNFRDDIEPEIERQRFRELIVVSNKYHVWRCRFLVWMRREYFNWTKVHVIGSEEWAEQAFTPWPPHPRSYYMKERVKEIILTAILLIDPEYKLIGKYRVWKRSRRHK